MAVTRRNVSVQTFKPMWPEPSSLSAERVRFTYDRPADTVFVDFHAEALPAASVPLDRGDRDYLFLRVDPDSDAVVGLQIEHFLSYAIHRHPELVGVLDFATLVGIDPASLRQITNAGSARTSREQLLKEIVRLSE